MTLIHLSLGVLERIFSKSVSRYWMREIFQLSGVIDLLSRDCDGCSHMKICRKRYYKVEKGEKVYCPDGTAHLVDYASIDVSIAAVS